MPIPQLLQIVATQDESKALLRLFSQKLAHQIAGIAGFISLAIPYFNRRAKVLGRLADKIREAEVIRRGPSETEALFIIQQDTAAFKIVMKAGHQYYFLYWSEAEHLFGQIEMTVVDGIEAAAQEGKGSGQIVPVWHIT